MEQGLGKRNILKKKVYNTCPMKSTKETMGNGDELS